MAVQDIVLDGFGSTGSVSLIVTSGFSSGADTPVVVEEPASGGWPYGYTFKRKKKKAVEEVEEKIEVNEIEHEHLTARLEKERKAKERLDSKARRSKAEQTALLKLNAGIAADMQAIEEMRRNYEELLTLRALELYVDTKRRKRNQLIAVTLA